MSGRDRQYGVAPLSILVAVIGICLLGGTSAAYPLVRGLAQACGAAIIGIAIAAGAARLPRDGFLRILVAAAILILLAQAIPLPPGVWTALPGREIIAQADRAMGWTLWRPLTLDWEASLSALLFLIPCLALMTAGARATWRSGIASAFAIGGALAALWAIVQMASGDWARPFETTHAAYATGPFLNRNHLALFATCTALLAVAALHGNEREYGRRDALPFGHVLAVGAMALAGVAVLLSASRSGLAVYFLALIALAWAWLADLWHSRSRAALALGVTAAVLAGLLAYLLQDAGGPLVAIAQRGSVMLDRRFEIWPASFALAKDYWPSGSGFGTFRAVYAAAEPLSQVRPLYVNHAHNEYLELLVEGGLSMAAILAGFLIWLVMRTAAILSRTDATSIERIALLCLWLIALQSLVEYPARTAAVAALAGFCIAVIARGGPSVPLRNTPRR